MKIIITGGHITPALAVIDYIQKKEIKDQILFLGRRYSQKANRQKAVEEFEVKKRNVKFVPFEAASFSSKIRFPWDLLIFIYSLIKALTILIRYRPDVVLSFGSFIALPVVIAAKVLGIKIVSHEQTRVLGKSNQLILKLADSFAISFEDSQQLIDKKYHHKIYVTGNAIRPDILSPHIIQPEWFDTKQTKPILLIMGGNQGSLFLNNFVKMNLSKLLEKWTIIHICGRPTKNNHYKKELIEQQKKLKQKQAKIYYIHEWLSENELAWIYKNAALCLCRAGANTIIELIVTKLPSILVPLPHAKQQEQLKNSQWIAIKGGGLVLYQLALNFESFNQYSEQIIQDRQTFVRNLETIDPILNADEKIYQLMKNTINA